MIPSLKIIDQELETLDSQLDQLAHQLYDAYQEYLTSLGQAVRRQLILASYHLCTQGYPEHFLALSLSQRQEFQKELRDLAQRSQTELLTRLPNLPTFNNEEPDNNKASEQNDADQSANHETNDTSQSSDDPSEPLLIDGVTNSVQSLEAAPHDLSVAHPLTDPENNSQDEIDQSEDIFPVENKDSDLLDLSPKQSDSDAPKSDRLNSEFSNLEASQSPTSPPDQIPTTSEQGNPDNDAQTASFFEFVLRSRASQSSSSEQGDSSRNSTPPNSLDGNSLPSSPSSENIPHLDPESQAKLAALAALLSSRSRDAEEENEPDQTLTPRAIARWHEQAEDNITDVLHTLSHTTNQLLQTYHILGMSLPDPVLEVASKTELVSESAPPLPNLLKLRIEAETEEKEALETAQLLIIHLRLSEIEFGDPSLSPKRSRIRELLARLQQVGRKYYRKHRERAIAEAESAWRASWFDD